VPIGKLLSIPELSVSPAMVLLSRASPGVSQTPLEPPQRRRGVDHAYPIQGDAKPRKGSRMRFQLIHVEDEELVDQGLESLLPSRSPVTSSSACQSSASTSR
jgi:hypothetical protein